MHRARPTLATCALLGALLGAVLAAAPAAHATERRTIAAGDHLLLSISDEVVYQEFVVALPRDARFKVKVKATKGSDLYPARGLYAADYSTIELLPSGRTGGVTAPLAASADYRLLVTGAKDTRGDLKVDTSVAPARRATLSAAATDEAPATELVFGALPGYEIGYALSWKGEFPVRVARVEGPDGGELTTVVAPKEKKTTARGGGYPTQRLGDHRVVLDVPEGTEKWKLTVTLKGRPTPGTTLDLRDGGAPVADGVVLEALGIKLVGGQGAPLTIVPRIRIVGESGGANELIVSAAAPPTGAGRPVALLPNGCAFAVDPEETVPTHYTIACGQTHAAVADEIERGPDDEVLGFVLHDITTPGGGGLARFSDFTYAENGDPTGWTEERQFETGGALHRLVVSDVHRYESGAYTYTVHHTPPGGATRRYDYLPFK